MTKKLPRFTARTRAALLQRVAEGNWTAAQLAAEFGVSLQTLADWVSRPEVVAAMDSLAQLSDFRARFLLGAFGPSAIAQLVQLGRESADPELARKACVDLVRAYAPKPSPPRPAQRDEVIAPAEAAPDPRDILAALERMGQRDLDLSAQLLGQRQEGLGLEVEDSVAQWPRAEACGSSRDA